ncbi:hypothetical protein NDU88_003365 [Pleurodeles waltl]|uniref:Uncharacterized protein n=1 Tax=Pleurodeles waltl TaxID=8319 RepID=A0AAV7WS58_PLEWA|nr:hypothetical protein NDU88_003365 [Pleurodeles waltl]
MWGSLLSTLDVMATAIKDQADKQDIQDDLLNIMAKYIVGIDSKLQALKDLIQRAQKQNYVQQVACGCAVSGNNPQIKVPILNGILVEVRAQALSTRERLRVVELEEAGKCEEENIVMENLSGEPFNASYPQATT